METKTSCTLIADARERHVLRHEKEFEGISVEVKQITTGDYVVLTPTGNILAVVERKSLEDFAASLKDGRHGNKQKLNELRAQTGCRVIYIIEGPEFPSPNDCFGNIPYRYIESSIFHLMIRDGVSVVRTESSLGTAKTLARFVRSMDTLVEKIGDDGIGGADQAPMPIGALADPGAQPVSRDCVVAMLTRKHEKSDHDVARELWSCFKGISMESADEFARVWSVADIVCGRAERKAINEFRMANGKKIGKNAANSLQAVDKMTEIRLLSTVPMVSHSMAVDVVGQVPLARLLSYGAGAMSIIKVGKVRRNLGEERARKILHYFNYKYAPAAKVDDPPAEVPVGAIDDPEVNALLDLI